jgi:hypothetical protein
MNSHTTTTRRFPSGWRIVAWLGLLLTAWEAFTRNWNTAIGSALVTAGMFVSARDDFNAKLWTKVAAIALTIAAVVVWTVW